MMARFVAMWVCAIGVVGCDGQRVPAPTAIHVAMSFVANTGQWEAPVSHVLLGGGVDVALLADAGVIYRTPSEQVALDFDGGVARPRERAGGRSDVMFHFFRGSERVTGAVTHEHVVFGDVYPGIDVGYSVVEGHLKYDVVVDRTADPDSVVVKCSGIERLRIAEDGALVLDTTGASLRQPAPQTWQEFESGAREPVTCSYRLIDDRRFGFDTSAWDRRGTLVIDPGLEYGTYLGGAAGSDKLGYITFAEDGDMIMAGTTASADFPVTDGAYDTEYGGGFPLFGDDVYVMRFDPSGTELRYATFLGGGMNDSATSVDVADDGGVLVSGWTGSSDFPTTADAYKTETEFIDAFVTRLTPEGDALVFSTLVGGAMPDFSEGARFLPDGDIVMAGFTQSDDFPVSPDAFDAEKTSFDEGFVAWLSADGTQLKHATFIGGSSTDFTEAMAVAPNGDVIVAGRTQSIDLPTKGFPSVTSTSFLSRFTHEGDAVFSRYIGGGTGLTQLRDLAVDDAGDLLVLGDTNEDMFFPTTPGAYDETFNGTSDAFVMKFEPTGELVFSTFVGGGAEERAAQIAVDSAGVSTIVGYTRATDFPTTPGAFQTTKPRGFFGRVLFVSQLSRDGNRLFASTYLGGEGGELGTLDSIADSIPVALTSTGEVWTGGRTSSPLMIVTPDAFDPFYDDLTDAYLARLDMLPTGVEKYGASTPGAAGPLVVGVTSMPLVGSETFGFTCTNAPPFTQGFLVIADATLEPPVDVAGVDLWVDTTSAVAVPVKSDDLGAVEVPFRLKDDTALIGAEAAVQFLWFGGTPLRPTSASNAVHVTVQP